MAPVPNLHTRILFEQLQRDAAQRRLSMGASAGHSTHHPFECVLERLRALFLAHDTTPAAPPCAPGCEPSREAPCAVAA